MNRQEIIKKLSNYLSSIFSRNFTGCYDKSGYAIYKKDRIKVICYGGPNYYNVFWKDGCFWIKEEQIPEEIKQYGEHVEPLYWLINSYMGYYVVDANISPNDD